MSIEIERIAQATQAALDARAAQGNQARQNTQTEIASPANQFEHRSRAAHPDSSPVVVIGAMDSEINVVEAALDTIHSVDNRVYRFVQGTMRGIPVVVARSLMGMTNAAASAALAIERFNPRYVVVQGLAGAHNRNIHAGNIVVGKAVRNIHAINTQARSQGMGSDQATWEYPGTEIIIDDECKIRNLIDCTEQLVRIAETVPYSSGSTFTGIIGSGDVWNREIDRIAMFHETFGIDCEDMESFSVGQVCIHLGVPWIAIRAISNNEHHPDEIFDPSLGSSCQHFIMDFIEAAADQTFGM